MEAETKKKILVENTIAAPVDKVWKLWTEPAHIQNWNNASDDWHTPRAENDLKTGGKFLTRMEARDGSFGFDFGGTYDEVRPKEYIEYTLGDSRKVRVTFSEEGGKTHVSEVFEAESVNTPELQKAGWQAILDNFKKYVESN